MKILFVYQSLMSFVEKDLRILQARHEVQPLPWRGVRDLPKLGAGVHWCDLVFCWFGKLHAYFAVHLARRRGKKSVVVAGGDDVANEPDIPYGIYTHRWKRWCPDYVFRQTNLALCVSQSNFGETLLNTKVAKRQVRLLYHGFDSEKWRAYSGIDKEPIALTVGRVTAETLKKKGIANFIEAAQLLPEVEFYVVGPIAPEVRSALLADSPPNVVCPGGLYGTDLVEMYSRAKAYVQVSLHESFGCSVAEAMLCECTPVVSRRGALPEVVGEAGFYVEDLQPKNVAIMIEKALEADRGQAARERIKREFPLEKRRQALLEAVESL